MQRSIRLLLLISMVSIYPAASDSREPDPLPHASEFTEKLGMTVEDLFSNNDIPESIFPYRGELPEEDNVVFYYPDNLYLFLFHDRVWQLRVDERWENEVDGVRMGMSRQKVEEIWGPPINSWDENPTWQLPDKGYPVRIRLYFSENNKLIDLYVYRSDW